MSDVVRVMTFNLNAGLVQGPNAWRNRSSRCIETIQRYSPDLLGLQEVTSEALGTVDGALSGYSHVAGNCYGENPPQELSSIFWKSSLFDLVESGEFWFSETPGVQSSGWGVPYPMGATWVRLRVRGGASEFVLMNTHFEDGREGERSRLEASRLIADRLGTIAPRSPAILTGDFNCNPWSGPYRTFIDRGFTDTYRDAGHADSQLSSTFHAFKGAQYFALEYGDEIYWRVDWILVRNGTQPIQTTSSTIVRDASPPTYPSDHYPVVSELIL